MKFKEEFHNITYQKKKRRSRNVLIKKKKHIASLLTIDQNSNNEPFGPGALSPSMLQSDRY